MLPSTLLGWSCLNTCVRGTVDRPGTTLLTIFSYLGQVWGMFCCTITWLTPSILGMFWEDLWDTFRAMSPTFTIILASLSYFSLRVLLIHGLHCTFGFLGLTLPVTIYYYIIYYLHYFGFVFNLGLYRLHIYLQFHLCQFCSEFPISVISHPHLFSISFFNSVCFVSDFLPLHFPLHFFSISFYIPNNFHSNFPTSIFPFCYYPQHCPSSISSMVPCLNYFRIPISSF